MPPIELDTPVQAPAIVAMELGHFAVDLRAMTVAVRFDEIDESGARNGSVSGDLSLLDGNGVPRFTAQEYATIKAAIYRLSIADGVVAGKVI